MNLMTFIKTLTLVTAAIIAVISYLLAIFVFRRGILNTALWIVGVGALVIGAVNKLSYG